MFPELDTIAYMERLLTDDHSGVEKPAAIILETIQADGGIYVFDSQWLRDLRALCDKYDILLIVDDIQVGCGRGGYFFSFERAGIVPDMVTMSKSIGGFGMPMSIVLMKPELDQWEPGQHTAPSGATSFPWWPERPVWRSWRKRTCWKMSAGRPRSWRIS